MATERAKTHPEIGHVERLIPDTHMKGQPREEAGTKICSRCDSVGIHKHWFSDRKITEKYAADPLTYETICPGCERIQNQIYEGEVLLDSPLIQKNREMVYGTIYHTAAKAYHDNPLARVAHIEEKGNRIHILTTTKSLATRLGKAIYKALSGTLTIKPSPGEQYVIVHWSRVDDQS